MLSTVVCKLDSVTNDDGRRQTLEILRMVRDGCRLEVSNQYLSMRGEKEKRLIKCLADYYSAEVIYFDESCS